MFTLDEQYCMEQFQKLLSIDSTTGMFREIQEYLTEEIGRLGFPVTALHKGGVIADLGGSGNTLAVTAHVDDIGLMVRHINSDGTLNVCAVGGLYPFYSVTENVRVHTRDGKVFTGAVCRTPSSIHVTEDELRSTIGDFRTNVCVVLDENTTTAEQTRALGIGTGDMIALEPRLTVSNGYIKSRFIDDKACAAVLLAAMKEIKYKQYTLPRQVLAYFSVYEEIGHGTSWLPDDVKDILAIDIAPTGERQTSDERKVSIFCKDSRYPYHWELTNELRAAAIREDVDYVMDVFTPHYGSDGDTSIAAGHDVRHAAIGPGTANSHGYERTHMDGLKNTYGLLMTYLLKEQSEEK
ncbi:MAG: M42 family metallopeptidase [Eubacterium sp.]|nr:M42 family metallopeptidase [Eubacterium sp.]